MSLRMVGSGTSAAMDGDGVDDGNDDEDEDDRVRMGMTV